MKPPPRSFSIDVGSMHSELNHRSGSTNYTSSLFFDDHDNGKYYFQWEFFIFSFDFDRLLFSFIRKDASTTTSFHPTSTSHYLHSSRYSNSTGNNSSLLSNSPSSTAATYGLVSWKSLQFDFTAKRILTYFLYSLPLLLLILTWNQL